MSRPDDESRFLDDLIGAGHLVSTGVLGCHGTGSVMEDVIVAFGSLIDRTLHDADSVQSTSIRFPPLIPSASLIASGFMESMPQLAGLVHSFDGNERQHRELLALFHATGDERWEGRLTPTELALSPAGCYPLYPTCTGELPEDGRLFDLGVAEVFRCEPSIDPARMQSFRVREIVRIADADVASAWRDRWVELAVTALKSLGLEVECDVANDPFFGRGGEVMADAQRSRQLKLELTVPIGGVSMQRAIASFNYHLDHFGQAFAITTADQRAAHSACLGFGLERVALALFWRHGLDPRSWSPEIREVLWP